MIEKINELSGVNPINSVKNRRAAYGMEETSGVQDGFAVSSFAQEMAAIDAELKKIPEIREDRVQAVKSQIEDGTYQPDLNALASRLVWAGINKIES